MKFYDRLKEIRIGKGLTQRQVAESIGITEQSFQRYERGTVKPGLDILVALSNFFDVTIDYLVGKSDLPDYSSSEDTTPFPLMAIRLRKLREEKGLDIFTVSEAIQENPRNYAGYEEGEVLPRLRVICALADYFDVSLDYLVGRSNVAERR